MGGTKSKPREGGPRSRSLDIAEGSHTPFPSLSASQTPSKSLDSHRPSNQPFGGNCDLTPFGGVNFSDTITSPQRTGPLSGAYMELSMKWWPKPWTRYLEQLQDEISGVWEISVHWLNKLWFPLILWLTESVPLAVGGSAYMTGHLWGIYVL